MIITKNHSHSVAEPILLALGRIAQQQAAAFGTEKTLAQRLAELDLEEKDRALMEEPERWDGMA